MFATSVLPSVRPRAAQFPRCLRSAVLFLLSAPAVLLADTTLVFNELHYHPRQSEATREWIELHNQLVADLDISGWRLEDGVQFTFPPGTIVPGQGYIVVAADPASLAQAGYADALGPFAGRLDNGGETLLLMNNNERRMDRLRYRDAGDWPVPPDGSGATLAKRHPDAASEEEASWTWSAQIGGTPGAANFPLPGAPPPPPGGLVSYWSLDGTSLAVTDAIGGNHGSRGSTTDRVEGLVGPGALDFDNTHNAFVDVGDGEGSFAVSDGITIEALLLSRFSGEADDADTIFRKEDGLQRIVLTIQNDGNDDGLSDPPVDPGYDGPVLAFGLNIGGVYAELDMPLDGLEGRPSLEKLTDDVTDHVAATYDAASGRKAIHYNGQVVHETSYPPGSTISSGGVTSAYIGNMAGRLQGFGGIIDEVAFWNVALEDAEVAAHAARARAGDDYFADSSSPEEAPSLRFSEVQLAPGKPAWIELENFGTAEVDLGGLTLVSSAGTGAGTPFELPSLALTAGGFHVVDAADFPSGLLPGEKLFLVDTVAGRVLDGVFLRDDHRALGPGEIGDPPRWLFPSAATPGAANAFELRSDIVINEIHYHPFPTPAVPAEFDQTEVVPMLSNWEYAAPDEGLAGTSWRTGGGDPAPWSQGGALLYVENAGLPAPKTTPLELGPTTFYFRTTFEFTGELDGVELTLEHIVDDGAVFYLNGVEIHRFNMNEGVVTPSTLASPGVSNASLVGPVALPTEQLRQGTNHFAVEVHQASSNSSDVVFGAALGTRTLVSPAIPFGDSPEAWIELHNLGDAAVDIGGWELDEGVEYLFAPQTTIPAGGYLVVADDAAFLRAKYPGIEIVGDLGQRLSRADDHIELKDLAGNPVDVVRYRDDGRWPDLADGGGSSLELRDPRADNRRAEAWDASDETQQTEWKTYSYRKVAEPNVGPTLWREFVMGLLDTGAALIDDIEVVEDPDGAAISLLQNGDFESGTDAWRILGNHRHSEVIDDPDQPGNRVLRLVATGPTEHMHNHLETTLQDNRSIFNGRTYEVSFRARWLWGSPRLNTRLYFNRAPFSTVLDGPETSGTPGRENSVRESNIGPTYDGLQHDPVVPEAGEVVRVEVLASDPDGIESADVLYSTGGGWARVPMQLGADGLLAGTIPGQSASTLVQFYVEARDARGAVSWFPAGGPDSRALYRVDDRRDRSGPLHAFRLLMTVADTQFLHDEFNVMSNERLGATVIYRERDVYYDVGLRLKGSERGRLGSARVSFSLRFSPERKFRGVHESVSLDRSGGWGIGAGPTGQDEIMVKDIVNRAGSLPGMYDDLGYIIAPRSSEDGPSLVMMAKYTDVFLESQYEEGDEGNLYKLELIYYPTTTSGGVEGLKRPQPDNVITTDLRDLGDDPEAYRWNFLKENNRDADDFSDLMGLAKFLGQASGTVATQAEDYLDVDEAVRMYAVHSLCGVGDAYWYAGNHHNVVVYRRPIDDRFQFLYWDDDFAFRQSVTGPLWGSVNLAKVFALPRYQRMIYGHFHDVIDRTLSTPDLDRWTTHYGELVREEASFGAVRNYLIQRRNYVASRLPASGPLEILTNGGEDMDVSTATITVQGEAPIDVRRLQFPGRPEPSVQWPTVTRWEVTLELAPGANRIVVEAYDHADAYAGSDEITVTTTFEFPAPTVASVDPPAAEPEANVTIDGSGFRPGAEVLLDGEPIEGSTREGDSRLRCNVPFVEAGEYSLTVENVDGKASEPVGFTVLPTLERFVRGDANLDGLVEIGDALRVLLHLYRGQPLSCVEAGDVNDDDGIDSADATAILAHLFLDGAPPPPPFPRPGSDARPGSLGCESGLFGTR